MYCPHGAKRLSMDGMVFFPERSHRVLGVWTSFTVSVSLQVYWLASVQKDEMEEIPSWRHSGHQLPKRRRRQAISILLAPATAYDKNSASFKSNNFHSKYTTCTICKKQDHQCLFKESSRRLEVHSRSQQRADRRWEDFVQSEAFRSPSR